LGDRVQFLDFGEDAPVVDEILEAAGKLFAQRPEGVKAALVIDPWNEIDHYRDQSLSETEYIARTLGRIRRWARMWDAHVFIVAHPAKQPRENGKLPIPKPDMIAGAAHWWNKADHCITVWRNFEDDETEIHVLKVKFRHIGKLGMAPLRFDVVTGRYMEPERDEHGRLYHFSGAK
jgi:twinkle protein